MKFTGKAMKGYVFVNEDGFKTKKQFDYWINLCLEFNKKAKAAKKKKAKINYFLFRTFCIFFKTVNSLNRYHHHEKNLKVPNPSTDCLKYLPSSPQKGTLQKKCKVLFLFKTYIFTQIAF